MRKILIIIALVFGLGAIAWPAAASPTESFEPIDTAAGGVQSVSAHSTVSETEVNLTWMDDEEASALGTSAESTNLGIEVEAGEEITVDYALTDGANSNTTAVRLFIYYSPDADTWNDAPDQSTPAPDGDTPDSGTLTIAATGGTIGTAGVVYDTSNGGVEGTVVFTNLTVAGESVPFIAPPPPPPESCEWDDELTADDPECVQPLATSDKTCDDFTSASQLTAHLVEFPGDADRLDGDNDGTACDDLFDVKTPVTLPTSVPAGLNTLPDTGPSTGVIVALLTGLGALAGAGALLLWRRRALSH
jgi:LPXTG-motif cell wall-anchored protein